MNDHFYSAFQKIGTFRIVNGQKQGGNVATYFCRADGTVLHAIAGPVDARTFLREARWVVEMQKKAIFEAKGNAEAYRNTFKKAHAERYLEEYGNALVNRSSRGNLGQMNARLPNQRPMGQPPQGQVEWLLGSRVPPKLNDIYKIVYEDILGERISNLPVLER